MSFGKRACAEVLCVVVGLTPFLAGCVAKPDATSQDPESQHMSQIGTLVAEYKKDKKKAPKNTAELKKWAVAKGKAKDEDFVSTRDGQEYVVEPVGGMMAMMPGGSGVVIHEQTGKDGKKFGIPPQGGSPGEMSDETLQEFTQASKSGGRPK